MNRELEEYCEYMKKVHNMFQWQIGWESLPKYIGHKIMNTNTNQVVTVNWDEWFYYDDDKDNYFVCNDFRGREGYWIYRIGEDYE